MPTPARPLTRLTRAALLPLALASALTLSACGSDGGGASSTASASAIDCQSGTIKSSGSSAQKNAITEWINTYQTECPDATIEYSPSGSGAGIQDFINNQTAFAGSDSALKPEEQTQADARCATGKAINLPMVVGPIAVAYNLPGVDSLVLDADTIAGIFANTITQWDDPKIADLNPDTKLPSAAIAQFHRSDSSGTTDNFTKYLAATAPTVWTFGNGKEWKAPGGQGAKGSDGVASALKSTPNSVGYVEYSFTQEGGLGVAQVDTGSGAVELTPETAGNALAEATVVGTGNDVTLKLNYATDAKDTYPIVLVTYEITCEKGLSATDLPLTQSFLTYTASDEGQALLADLGYGPLPDEIKTKVQASVAAIA